MPAALAVDSVRYSIADAEARAQWATCVSAPLLAGAFAVAWESENDELVSQLIEYHSARGTFSAERADAAALEWSRVSTAAAPISRRRRARAGRRGPADHRRHRADPAGSAAAAADGSDHGAACSTHYRELALAAVRPARHRGRTRLVDVALTRPTTLVLRFADVGVATYGSLRVVGEPVADRHLGGRGAADARARSTNSTARCPNPTPGESVADALARALATGPFAAAGRPNSRWPTGSGRLLLSDAGVAAAARLRVHAARGAVRLAERAAGARAVGTARLPRSAVADDWRPSRGDHPRPRWSNPWPTVSSM